VSLSSLLLLSLPLGLSLSLPDTLRVTVSLYFNARLICTITRRHFVPPRAQWYHLALTPLLKIPLTPELIVSFGVAFPESVGL
jgi:hypothetical protein